jgi:hypothetical protein
MKSIEMEHEDVVWIELLRVKGPMVGCCNESRGFLDLLNIGYCAI